MMAHARRSYGGKTPEQRLEDRRDRLISAGYLLFADLGFPGATIERLCSAARISNRAFYECFESREHVLLAVYERCVAEALEVVAERLKAAPQTFLGQLEAGLGGYIGYITADPRRARIVHVEVRRAGFSLHSARRDTVAVFAEIVENAARDVLESPPADLRLLSVGLVGAIQELIIEWSMSDDPPPVDNLTQAAIHIFRAALTS